MREYDLPNMYIHHNHLSLLTFYSNSLTLLQNIGIVIVVFVLVVFLVVLLLLLIYFHLCVNDCKLPFPFGIVKELPRSN